MGQILLGLFAAYLLYNFIFRFLIPVIKVTRQVKRQVREFQQHVNTPGSSQADSSANGGYQPGGAPSGQYQAAGFRVEDLGTNPGPSSYRNGKTSDNAKQEVKPKKDDYIDFEEVK